LRTLFALLDLNYSLAVEFIRDDVSEFSCVTIDYSLALKELNRFTVYGSGVSLLDLSSLGEFLLVS
jgi:hypothetical protein